MLISPQHNTGVLSDVASKPIFIAKPENRAQAAKNMGVENYVVIDSDSKIRISPSMAKRIIWLDKDAEKHALNTQP